MPLVSIEQVAGHIFDYIVIGKSNFSTLYVQGYSHRIHLCFQVAAYV